jgi:hypothetical protein
MCGGGNMQIIAYGSNYKLDYSYNNKIGFGKTNPYTGKNNFYKIKNKKKSEKKEDIIAKSEIKEKNKVFTIGNKTLINNFKKSDVNKNYSIISTDNKNVNLSNNLIRLFSVKLYIKHFILEYIHGFLSNNQLDKELNYYLISELYIKIYLVLIVIIFYSCDKIESEKKFDSIYINNINVAYFLILKNYIRENNKNMNKFIKVIDEHFQLFLKNKFNCKNKIKLCYDSDEVNNIIDKDKKNNNIIKPNQKQKTDNLCIITLDELSDQYFYCKECGVKYNPDGYLYWSESHSNCSTKWCTNSLSNLYYCVEKKNNVNLHNKYKQISADTNLSSLYTYYQIVISL